MVDTDVCVHQGSLERDVKYEMHVKVILARTVELAFQSTETVDTNVSAQQDSVDHDVKHVCSLIRMTSILLYVVLKLS